MEHTPTPWNRNIPPATKYSVIFAARNTHVAKVVTDGLSADEVEANMDFIVTACNAHDQLAAENAALHEQLTRKDEACNNAINAALTAPDPVHEQLAVALKRLVAAMTYLYGDQVKEALVDARTALAAAGVA